MGLTVSSTGKNAVVGSLAVEKQHDGDRIIALAGNPNVGKSTVFNALTGLNQHTGNWPGKTVGSAQGAHHFHGTDYILVDLPGTYSLMAHSPEEEVARDFLLYGGADAAIVVCDATCLERNLNLVLQTMEITPNVVVCVNLLDEARKKGIRIDLAALESELGVPVVGTSARAGKGLSDLMDTVRRLTGGEIVTKPRLIRYPRPVEEALAVLTPVIEQHVGANINARWLSLRLL
ncbi:MAG: 50S ribosome-binding GTPase, partial [Oscillospiraceae bacterium]|nr:50S ribosome-binding GTPase [Oscillospiraceae bacterium]